MTLRHSWYAFSLSRLAVRLIHCHALPFMCLGMAFGAQIISQYALCISCCGQGCVLLYMLSLDLYVCR